MSAKNSLFPTLTNLKTRCKRNKLIPEPNSRFLTVKCKECEATRIVYTHSQTKIACQGCGYVLITPKGGRGKLGSNIMFKVADRHKTK